MRRPHDTRELIWGTPRMETAPFRGMNSYLESTLHEPSIPTREGSYRESHGRGLFAGKDLFYVVEFVEGGHGGQVVDVDMEDLVAYLGKDGVVKLEE